MGPLRLIGPLAGWELRRLARRGTATRVRLVLVYVLSLAFVVFALLDSVRSPRTALPSDVAGLRLHASAEFAGRFVLVFLEVQLAAVVAVTPAVAASSVAEEKDRQTLPLLLTTTLTDHEIVFGKAAGRIMFVLAAVFAGLPVLMLTLPFGGVDAGLVVAGYALTAGTVVLCAAIGMNAACHAPDLRSALLRAYGVVAVVVCVPLLPVLAFADRDSSGGLLVVGCVFPLAQVLVGVGLLVSAARSLRLREVSAGPRPWTAFPEPPRPAEPPLLLPARAAAPQLPPVDQSNPVLWKERCVGWRPDWAVPALARVLAAAATVLAVLLFLGGTWQVMKRTAKALDPAEAEQLAQRVGQDRPPDFGGSLLIGAAVFAAARYLLPLAVGVTGAIAGERRRGTLDALLSTALDRRAILRAKVRAHAERGAEFGAVAATALGMAFVADAGPRPALAAVALCASGVGLVIGLGASLSVRCSGDVRAFRLLLPVTVVAIGWPVGVWNLLRPTGPEPAVSGAAATWWLLAAAVACAAAGLLLWWRAGAELERGE